MFGIEQLECVSYGIVCGMFYCVVNEMALINEDECHERELRKLVVKTQPRSFWNVIFSLICARYSNYFMYFRCLFIERLI